MRSAQTRVSLRDLLSVYVRHRSWSLDLYTEHNPGSALDAGRGRDRTSADRASFDNLHPSRSHRASVLCLSPRFGRVSKTVLNALNTPSQSASSLLARSLVLTRSPQARRLAPLALLALVRPSLPSKLADTEPGRARPPLNCRASVRLVRMDRPVSVSYPAQSLTSLPPDRS